MGIFRDEFDYLIHLVRCVIREEQPQELPEDFDFQRVYEYGEYHHIANMAFYSVEKLIKKPEPTLYAQWETCRDRAVIREINQSFAADELRDAFRNAGIRSLEVQGTKIKPLYPQPDHRTMSDIDFIIDPENLSKAWAILESLGYECKDEHGVEVDAFRAPNINIEVHTEYFPRDSKYHAVMRPPFSSVEEAGEYDLNEFYLYNILHIVKHYIGGGCGIRRMLDLYYLNRHYSSLIDRKYIRTFLKMLGDVELVSELTALADSWFGDGRAAPERSETERYILNAGLHGTKPNAVSNRVKRNYQGNLWFARMGYFLQRIVGTKEILYKTHPILKRWKILYPLCWIHRVFCAFRPQKLKQLRKEIKVVMNTVPDDGNQAQNPPRR